MRTRCLAITSSKIQCSRDAKNNGFCTQHANMKKSLSLNNSNLINTQIPSLNNTQISSLNNSNLKDSQDSSIENCEDYIECTCKKHHIFGSKHLKDKVPTELFRKNPLDGNSLLFKTCLDRRLYQRKADERMRSRHKKYTEEQKIHQIAMSYFVPIKAILL